MIENGKEMEKRKEDEMKKVIEIRRNSERDEGEIETERGGERL